MPFRSFQHVEAVWVSMELAFHLHHALAVELSPCRVEWALVGFIGFRG